MTIANPSSVKFDPFAEEHDRLHNLLHAVGRMLTERKVAQSKVFTALAELACEVKAHFAHEERQDGFFDAILEQAPRLGGSADVLLQQHASFAESLDRILLAAQQGAPSEPWWTALGRDFEEFCLKFSRHERAENELVQEAFLQDMGADD